MKLPFLALIVALSPLVYSQSTSKPTLFVSFNPVETESAHRALLDKTTPEHWAVMEFDEYQIVDTADVTQSYRLKTLTQILERMESPGQVFVLSEFPALNTLTHSHMRTNQPQGKRMVKDATVSASQYLSLSANGKTIRIGLEGPSSIERLSLPIETNENDTPPAFPELAQNRNTYPWQLSLNWYTKSLLSKSNGMKWTEQALEILHDHLRENESKLDLVCSQLSKKALANQELDLSLPGENNAFNLLDQTTQAQYRDHLTRSYKAYGFESAEMAQSFLDQANVKDRYNSLFLTIRTGESSFFSFQIGRSTAN